MDYSLEKADPNLLSQESPIILEQNIDIIIYYLPSSKQFDDDFLIKELQTLSNFYPSDCLQNMFLAFQSPNSKENDVDLLKHILQEVSIDELYKIRKIYPEKLKDIVLEFQSNLLQSNKLNLEETAATNASRICINRSNNLYFDRFKEILSKLEEIEELEKQIDSYIKIPENHEIINHRVESFFRALGNSFDLKLKYRSYFTFNEKLIQEDNEIAYIPWADKILDDKTEFVILETICSLLNYKGGRILLGIDNQVVNGIFLTFEEMHSFINKVDKLRGHFKPLLNKEFLDLEYVQIKDKNNKIMPGLYVLRILVKYDKNYIYTFEIEEDSFAFIRDKTENKILNSSDLEEARKMHPTIDFEIPREPLVPLLYVIKFKIDVTENFTTIIKDFEINFQTLRERKKEFSDYQILYVVSSNPEKLEKEVKKFMRERKLNDKQSLFETKIENLRSNKKWEDDLLSKEKEEDSVDIYFDEKVSKDINNAKIDQFLSQSWNNIKNIKLFAAYLSRKTKLTYPIQLQAMTHHGLRENNRTLNFLKKFQVDFSNIEMRFILKKIKKKIQEEGFSILRKTEEICSYY